MDALDTSTNKAPSPTSSITSQRKLEWDSLADVGYANESDRKTSSSLSTLERLALKQQYSNNDTKLDSILEPPTAHSTPLDENEAKSSKKGVGKKSTKIYKKDVDYLEVNMPHSSENNPPQSINVNLTKHIFFNVEKDGAVTVENVHKDVSVLTEKINVKSAVSPRDRMDKEMQTSLTKSKDTSAPKPVQITPQKVPVLVSLNTLRRLSRRKKLRMARRKMKSQKIDKENIPVQEKSAEQLSEAESFEYMPGHMYNQNQLTANERSGNTTGNKSSLESSGLLTTDSSKASKYSFTKDLEKSIDILHTALQRGGDDMNLRKQLIKQVCERLLKTKYKDDESSSAFLSGLSLSSKKLDLGNLTTTSTSDNSGEKFKRPKKSILRNDNFNSGAIASTSQSAPNLPTATNSEKLVCSNLMKNQTTSNTDSDMSHKEKSSSDNVPKTSSQELYQRYLDALKREEAYKRHLRDKEMFLKQKLVCSDSAIKSPTRPDPKLNNRLKDLIKDLTRNNYDDGSGDASKLEGGPNSSHGYDRYLSNRSQRSHSVFTLSSGGNSDQNKKQNLKKQLQSDLKDLSKPGTSNEHYSCRSHHSPKFKTCVVDSSVQVSIKPPCDDTSCEYKNISTRGKEAAFSPRQVEKGDSPRSLAKIVADDATEDIKYVCLCNNKTIQDVPDNFLIFKCSRLSKGSQEDTSSNASCRIRNVSPRKNKDSPNLPTTVIQCSNKNTRKNSPETICEMKTTTKSSQTNFVLKMLRRRSSDRSPISSCCDSKKCSNKDYDCCNKKHVNSIVYEATRCLQTEISINPRIPEPSLSDINFVTDCANLVGEHCRDVSKPSSSDVFSSHTHNKETPCYSGSSKSSGTSKEMGEHLEDSDNAFANKGKTFKVKEKVFQESKIDHSEKFTIPIQGTNMTLMVSIGSNERKNKPDDMIGQCVGTERTKVTEQCTSLAEECSKSVQYDIGLPSCAKTDYNSNNVGILKDQLNNPYFVNTCLTTQDHISNTYPKTNPVNERKTFRRANTDTDNIEKCAPLVSSDDADNPPGNKCKADDKNKTCSFGIKEHCTDKFNENIKSNQCEIHPIALTASVEKETQCSKPNSTKCSCGCAGNIENCNKNCDERKKSLPTDNSKCLCGCSGDKDHCNEKCNERKKRLSPKCSCGCYGTIDKCNKICDERKKSLTTKNVKKLESLICSCGCGGDKEKCNNNCDERKTSGSNQCSCGCLGDKENCDKNCDERKKCLNKEKVLTSPRCSCGCGGSVKNCKTNCDVRVKSLSTQCSCGCFGDKNKCSKNCEELKKSYVKEIATQKGSSSSSSSRTPTDSSNGLNKSTTPDTKNQNDCSVPSTSKNLCEGDSEKSSEKCKISENDIDKETDPILEMIQNITKKYSKKDIEKNTRKKCFKEIMTVLNYLLETEDNTDPTDDQCITSEKSATFSEKPQKISPCLPKKTEKPPSQKSKTQPCITESSDCPQSTDMPGTSSDSATCKVLNKIKKECEKYHQKRCKIHSGKKCDISSSTSANCDHCRRVHHCSCRTHKCKGHKKCEKTQKKAIAYNLILQTSESISEETVYDDQMRRLQNFVVKVPSQRKQCGNVPFKEMCAKIESRMPPCSPCEPKPCRSRSMPNESEISSMEEFLKKSQACCTVREYLEQNRPDFIAKSSQRQNCLRIVSDSR